MRALITGGAGFIGSHLSGKLLNLGYQVTIIDDLSTGTLENIQHLTGQENFTFAIENILNETVMDRLIYECDIIFHLAASVGVELIVSHPVAVIQTNILGTEMVLKIANRYKKKTLLTSTSEIYGKSNKVPFTEEDDSLMGPTTKNRWSYACSKAVDEFLALAYYHEKKLPVVIARLFNTVGPRQTGRYGMVIPRFVAYALKNEPIPVYGDGKQTRCFTYVDDTIEFITRLSRIPEAEGQIYNVGNTQEITIRELADKIRAMVGSTSEIRLVPYDQAFAEGFEDMLKRRPDITKVSGCTDYQPKYGLDSILEQVIAYVREVGPDAVLRPKVLK
ncbi:MAG: nucleoside-diphosphate sugar epimerase [Candidatus Glassbacteria bacterium RIFCSPLOWO2_12_FULL_58_11]|uniref:UDP-glucuronate decarboxylase n=1 Tax=Candidatus Glassbacteria bacterium RIFCSPLOWO2_12_FULL_58_11 TaxID=1817867 RepID=A0A1F5YMU8_9BACT|nr:MAG: nucleoside-diphosphate sugar epimerase [Candidatus Glassbacteria bacterium RIFCSPLOWO2_12_FULL_58_11]